MTLKDSLAVMKNEYQCIIRNDSGNCDRRCDKCDLVLPIEDIKAVYEDIIASIEYLIELRGSEDKK